LVTEKFFFKRIGRTGSEEVACGGFKFPMNIQEAAIANPVFGIK
jgi:hypothetical protein